MLRRHAVLLAARKRSSATKLPTPGSPLTNPRSFKYRERMAVAKGLAVNAAEASIVPPDTPDTKPPLPRVPKGKKSRTTEASAKLGRDIAEQARSMTDGEWEAVPLSEKHAFTKYVGQLLQENPTAVSEQQRRRYFETTLVDPRSFDHHQSVRDPYERIKLGLPVQLKNPERQLGVSQPIYETADATLFDPDNAQNIENAMTHVKQVFVDYVRNKRQGVSTEAERRKLSSLMANLNHETQRHLANMFKYADAKLLRMAKEERKRQLLHVQAAAEAIKNGGPSLHRDQGPDGTQRSSRTQKKRRLEEIMRNAYGLDAGVAASILRNMRAQENFLEMCEVMLRMLHGKGFEHSKADESLDAYVTHIKNLYSVDPQRLATLDLVQFVAAKERVPPVDWAKRWYEKALLVPLQQTEEYKALRRIQEEEERAARSALADSAAPSVIRSATETPDSADASSEGLPDGASRELVISREIAQVAAKKEGEVVNLVEKMFLRPDDHRLAGIHEKRLRYLAFMHMEDQIKKARERSKQFAGVEELPEAETCRTLYAKLEARKRELESQGTNEAAASGTGTPFDDEVIQQIFGEIQAVVKATIRRLRVQNAADRKAAQIQHVVRMLKGNPGEEGSAGESLSPAERAARVVQEKKRAVMDRVLSMVQRDVEEDVAWLENLEESERPPLLPIPEPMSYVSAQDILAWSEARHEHAAEQGNPFLKGSKRTSAGGFRPSLLGAQWKIPDKPLLFWGTGISALRQALRHAEEDADRRRKGEPLAPPYPCAENPWGWRLAQDILDD